MDKSQAIESVPREVQRIIGSRVWLEIMVDGSKSDTDCCIPHWLLHIQDHQHALGCLVHSILRDIHANES